MDLLQALDDPALFAPHFPGASWAPWKAFLAVASGQASKLPPDLLSLAGACTGREDIATTTSFAELWVVIGRRGGKSRIAALMATWIAVSKNWRQHTAPGEIATVAVIAADRSQARIVYRYIRALIRDTPMLREMVTLETQQRMELTNGSAVEVFVCSSVAVRGYSIACAILDEIAYWPAEGSADPDTEVLAALRPALATLPGSRLIAISSPYARRGELWRAYSENYGRPGARKLVWQATTRTMNQTVSAETVANALAEDEMRGRAEWLGEFRNDCERLVSREVIDAAVIPGRHELPPCANTRYHGFIDPSGGSSDSFTMAIAHREDNRAILDCIREYKPPFSPEVICQEIAAVLKTYSLCRVTSDKYGGVFPVEAMAKHGITVSQHADPKSQLYSTLLPALNSGKIDLLDNQRLLTQLAGLERRVSRSGRDSIDHAPRNHDDIINSAAGCLTLALAKPRSKMDLDNILYGPAPSANEMFLYLPRHDDWHTDDDDRHKWKGPSYV